MLKKKRQEVSSEESQVNPELLDMPGLALLISNGVKAQEEKKTKNRILLGLIISLLISITTNSVVGRGDPVVKVLAVTPDGRYKPLPVLSDPIYSHQDIMAWSERCVRDIYRLSYIDWRETLQNESYCLSDKARESFVKSLGDLGLLDNLTPENQGQLYASPSRPVMRASRQSPQGYAEWVVDVPYRVVLDGNRKGHLDVVMSMTIKRVSLLLRDPGIWVDSYRISPQGR